MFVGYQRLYDINVNCQKYHLFPALKTVVITKNETEGALISDVW